MLGPWRAEGTCDEVLDECLSATELPMLDKRTGGVVIGGPACKERLDPVVHGWVVSRPITRLSPFRGHPNGGERRLKRADARGPATLPSPQVRRPASPQARCVH